MADTLDKTQLVLITGESGTGKSASLRNLRGGSRILYFNCEAGKRLPFANSFYPIVITDPYHLLAGLKAVLPGGAQYDRFDTVIIDSATFLMDMFESLYIYGAANGQQAWADFQQYWKDLMQQHIAKCDKSVIITAHTFTKEEQKGGLIEYKTAVPVKGSLKNQGLEAYFSTVVSTKAKTLHDLEPYKNDLLHITEEDEAAGLKHVFQTRITKSTTGERIRGPMGLFSLAETFIDNDAQLLLDRMSSYYTPDSQTQGA